MCSKESPVGRARLQQLFVRPRREELALFEDHDPRDEFQNLRLHRVSDQEHCSPFDEVTQTLMDHGFALRVHGGSRLVQNQNRRINQQRASQSDSLTLPAGKPTAAWTDACCEAFGKLIEELRHMCLLGRGEHLGMSCIRIAVADVFINRVVEQQRLLSHHADLASQIAEPHVANVDSVNQHRSRVRVVEPWQQIDQRRFAAAVLADDHYDFSRCNLQRDVRQRVRAVDAVGVVLERDLFESDRLRMSRHELRFIGLLQRGLPVEHLKDAFGRGGRAFELRVNRRESTDRIERASQQGVKHRQVFDHHR